MTKAASQDTEITLGTGKMLALFFGLVALCAVFFGMGFSLGKSSTKVATTDPQPAAAIVANGGTRPPAVRAADSSPSPAADLTFYKAVAQKNGDAQLTPASNASSAPAPSSAPDTKPGAPDPMAAPPSNGYFVQVAAVSKQEDAEGLVEALKKKQYAAFANNTPPDKLFHVQVGPFGDIKDAELTRAKLVGDGYNPILKK